MFLGHYATALVPYQKTRSRGATAPFWLFLVAAQFLDFAMIALVSLGLEGFEPRLFEDAAFATMQTEMFYSHDLAPVLGWTVAFGLGVWIATRDRITAWWCAGLVAFHEVLDLAVGFEHYVLGEGTPAVGFNLYHRAPVFALLIEAAFCAGIVAWFAYRRKASGGPLSARTQWLLYLVLVGGTLATIPLANQPLASLIAH